MSEKNYADYIFRGASIAFIFGVATGVIGLLVRIFLSRSLSPIDYGIFYAVFSLIGFLKLFRKLGLGQAIVKFLPEFREKNKFTELKSSILSAVLVKLVVSSLMAGILFVFSEQVAMGFIGNRSAVSIIRLLSVWFVVMSLLSSGQKIFQGFGDIVGFKSVEFLRVLITFLILGVFSYFTDLEAPGTALAFVLGNILVGLWVLIRLKKHKTTLSKGEMKISKQVTKKMVFFGLPLMFSGLAGVITGRIDTIVITFFRTSKEVGFYQVARPATKIIMQAGSVVGVPLLPMVSELWAKKDMESLNFTMYYISKLSFLLLIPLVLIFLTFPKIIIRVLFSKQYLPAAGAMRILSVTMLVTVLFSIFGKTLVAIGKNRLHAKIYGVAAGLNLVGDLLLVPFIGIEGAALAFLFSFVVALLLEFHYTQKHIEFDIPIKAIGKIIIGGALTIVLILLLKSVLPFPIWPKIFLVLICGFIFYTIWIFGMSILTDEDFEMIRQTIPLPDLVFRILVFLKKALE